VKSKGRLDKKAMVEMAGDCDDIRGLRDGEKVATKLEFWG